MQTTQIYKGSCPLTLLGGLGLDDDEVNFVVKRLTITRKDGLFAGSACTHAFMTRAITGGQPLGMGIR